MVQPDVQEVAVLGDTACGRRSICPGMACGISATNNDNPSETDVFGFFLHSAALKAGNVMCDVSSWP